MLVLADGSCHLDDRFDAAVRGPEIPAIEVIFGVFRILRIEVLKGQPDLMGAGGFQVAAAQIETTELFGLCVSEVGLVLQPDIACTGQLGVCFCAPDAGPRRPLR